MVHPGYYQQYTPAMQQQLEMQNETGFTQKLIGANLQENL
jgi:hypothetical protein